MSRDLTIAFATALADQSLRPVIFFEGQFATGWVRIWSGLGEVSWNGESWAGAGSLLGLGPLGETGEVVAGGIEAQTRRVFARLEEALAALKRNTQLQPMSPFGWYQMARVHVDLKQTDEARAVIRHLKGFEPKVAAQLERETGLQVGSLI